MRKNPQYKLHFYLLPAELPTTNNNFGIDEMRINFLIFLLLEEKLTIGHDVLKKMKSKRKTPLSNNDYLKKKNSNQKDLCFPVQ